MDVMKRMVSNIKDKNYFEKNVLKSTGYVFIDYYAPWCGPCKRFAPTLDKLCEEYKNIKFYKIDVDELSDIGADQKISAFPTFVLYKDGIEQNRIIGASEEKVRNLLSV